jgi:hypothetical protein
VTLLCDLVEPWAPISRACAAWTSSYCELHFPTAFRCSFSAIQPTILHSPYFLPVCVPAG